MVKPSGRDSGDSLLCHRWVAEPKEISSLFHTFPTDKEKRNQPFGRREVYDLLIKNSHSHSSYTNDNKDSEFPLPFREPPL